MSIFWLSIIAMALYFIFKERLKKQYFLCVVGFFALGYFYNQANPSNDSHFCDGDWIFPAILAFFPFFCSWIDQKERKDKEKEEREKILDELIKEKMGK
jgi:hypothetical protein